MHTVLYAKLLDSDTSVRPWYNYEPLTEHDGGDKTSRQVGAIMSVQGDGGRMPSRNGNRLRLDLAVGTMSALALAGCGGSGSGGSNPMYSVSVTVSGLQTGTSVTLSDNGSDDLTVSANGTVAFAKTLPSGGAYAISVATQPTGQTCLVTGGSGTVAKSNINVAVGCTGKPYSIGGAVSGLLSGDSVGLDLAYGNANFSAGTISANGPFTLGGLEVPSGDSYSLTVGTQPVGEKCTISNGSGTVLGSNVTNVGVSCTALSYKVSAVVVGLTNVSGLVLQDNAGDDLAISTSGTWQFATALTEGQTYDVTVSTQPAGHMCSVLSDGNRIMGANVSVTVICPWHVGYTGLDQLGASGPTNSIAAFYIDQSTGATIQGQGSVAPAGNDPWALVVSPTAGFLYADNELDNTVSGYTIDPTTGVLSPVPGSPFPVGPALSSAGPYPHSIAIDPQGHFVYVLDWQGDVVAFGINSSTGSLTSLSTTPLPTGMSAIALTVSSRSVLYVIGTPSGGDAEVAAYSVNTSTGALTAASGSPFTFAPPTGSADSFTGYGWAIDPAARFFYVTFTQEGAIPRPVGAYTVASIASTTGALTAASGSPFALTHTVDSIAIDNTGTYFYGGNSYENLVQEFSIDQSRGVLTQFATDDLPGPLDNSGTYLSGIDPSNTYLYFFQNPYSTNSPYSINPSTGVLTRFAGGSNTTVYNAVPVAFSNTP